MKYVKLGVILLGVALIIISCEIPGEPQAPTLIAPEDGAVFDTLPPTFIWGWEEFADDYVIRIYMGSSTDIQDTLGDTTYAMSEALFETLLNGIYNWTAAAMSEEGELFWSGTRTFVIDKTEEPQGLDLDTTYFPFGLGYEWCYERCINRNLSYEYVTYTIRVTDSFWVGDTLIFDIPAEGNDGHRAYHFLDLVEREPILDNSIYIDVGVFAGYVGFIELEPRAGEKGFLFEISYNGDTLILEEDGDFSPDFEEGTTIKRIKGLGTVFQYYGYSDLEHGGFNYGGTDRLLYFYNGQDTVYKAD